MTPAIFVGLFLLGFLLAMAYFVYREVQAYLALKTKHAADAEAKRKADAEKVRAEQEAYYEAHKNDPIPESPPYVRFSTGVPYTYATGPTGPWMVGNPGRCPYCGRS